MILTLGVNGARRQVDVAPTDTLLTVVRDTLDLTGTKYGCGEGYCGACTVIVDGQAVKSCQLKASLAQGKAIRTIESLAENGHLHPVQEAFLAHEALQCGYCTPGMIKAGVALLAANPHPSDAVILRTMERNVCRSLPLVPRGVPSPTHQ